MNFQESKVLVLSLSAQSGIFFHFQNLLWVFLGVPRGHELHLAGTGTPGIYSRIWSNLLLSILCLNTHVGAEKPGSTETAVSQRPTRKRHSCEGQWRGLWKSLPCMPRSYWSLVCSGSLCEGRENDSYPNSTPQHSRSAQRRLASAQSFTKSLMKAHEDLTVALGCFTWFTHSQLREPGSSWKLHHFFQSTVSLHFSESIINQILPN